MNENEAIKIVLEAAFEYAHYCDKERWKDTKDGHAASATYWEVRAEVTRIAITKMKDIYDL